jgi:dolichyl-diphosphooligosaccharide--protein glycosyltransferase
MTSDSRLPAQLDGATAAEWVDRYAHVAVVLVLSAYMFVTRIRGWQRFVGDDGVLFRGADAWYHYRQVSYTVGHFPRTMPFDPWTAYPNGVAVGQFGTIFDQTVALAALVVGLGTPDAKTVGLTLLFTPPVLGTLVVVPTYLLGRHFAGRAGGVVAVAVLALTPGAFLQRSQVGFADHHVAETLLQATAMLAIVTAIRAIEEHDDPTGRDPVSVDDLGAGIGGVWATATGEFRRPLVMALLSGIAVAVYVFVWPPGVLIGLVLAACYAVHLSTEFVRGRNFEAIALVCGGSAVVTAVVLGFGIDSPGFDPGAVSLLQPALFFILALGLAGMVGLARVFRSLSLSRSWYPVTLGGLGLVLTLGVRVIAPARFEFVASYFLRVFGYTLSPGIGTTAEARRVAFDSIVPFLQLSYGFAFGLALVGVAIAAGRYLQSDGSRGPIPALVVWLGFMTMATLTQVRFDYYLVVPVAVSSGIAIAWVLRRTGLTAPSDVADLRWGQAAVVVVVALALVGPFVASAGADGVTLKPTASSAQWGPDEVTNWQGTLTWLRTNTPAEGTYGRPEAKPFPYYPTVAPTDDYAYPAGTYGVVSWWDAGHFLTVLGERIPVANPFQDGRTTAADFFLSRDESAAIRHVTWGDERARYVVVDWSLAVPGVGKYASPLEFTSERSRLRDLLRPIYRSSAGGRQFAGYVKQQAHYESLRVRLFRYHGSAKAPQPIVTDWETRALPTAEGDRIETAVVRANSAFVRRFETLAEARAFVRTDGSAQVGGVDGLPSERVPALEGYRLVHVSDRRYAVETISGTQRGPWVKTFERVPGATLRGRAPPNVTITAIVQLDPHAGSPFNYTQRARAGASGEFSMTLPYSTTGYDDWGPSEGYTNVSVRATGPYTLTATRNGTGRPVDSATVHVPEGAVVGAEPTPITVTLAAE